MHYFKATCKKISYNKTVYFEISFKIKETLGIKINQFLILFSNNKFWYNFEAFFGRLIV